MNTKIEKVKKNFKKNTGFINGNCVNVQIVTLKNGLTIKPKRKRSSYGSGLCVTLARLDKSCGTLADKLFREYFSVPKVVSPEVLKNM